MKTKNETPEELDEKELDKVSGGAFYGGEYGQATVYVKNCYVLDGQENCKITPDGDCASCWHYDKCYNMLKASK